MAFDGGKAHATFTKIWTKSMPTSRENRYHRSNLRFSALLTRSQSAIARFHLFKFKGKIIDIHKFQKEKKNTSNLSPMSIHPLRFIVINS